MKKAMLLFVTLLFSVSINAATLSISAAGSDNATQAIGLNNGSLVTASGVTQGGEWYSDFDVFTTADTKAIVEWSFNPDSAVSSAHLLFNNGGADQDFFVDGTFSQMVLLSAGLNNFVDFFQVFSTPLAYSLSVTAVPVPAALFLLAPALLGLLSLRRKQVLAA